MKRLDGKVVVVTGSTRGIGKAIADACGEAGAKLVICSRREASVRDVCIEFEQKRYPVTGIAADVSRVEDLQRLFDHSLATWGKIDVWINNAGVSSGYRRLDDIPGEEIAKVVEINLTATLQACRLVIPYFRERGEGILLNMSGRGGNGDAVPFMVPYTATKAAVTSLTKSLAEENKDHAISINAIMPGMVQTDILEDVETGPEAAEQMQALPYALNAFGVPLETVGEFVADIAAQEPGKETGKSYSLLKGGRLLRGIALMSWYRLTGKI